MNESHKRKYDSFTMYVQILSKARCVYMRKKTVAFEKSCVYSVVHVVFKAVENVLLFTSDASQVAALSRNSTVLLFSMLLTC